MDIQQFTALIQKLCQEQMQPNLLRYETDVPDYRFGIPDKYVAVSFEQNNTSTIFEFRVGLTTLLIDKFNQLPGANAVNHATSKDMFKVTINNDNFSQEIMNIIEKSCLKAISRFFQS
jgi:hypothetical protein